MVAAGVLLRAVQEIGGWSEDAGALRASNGTVQTRGRLITPPCGLSRRAGDPDRRMPGLLSSRYHDVGRRRARKHDPRASLVTGVGQSGGGRRGARHCDCRVPRSALPVGSPEVIEDGPVVGFPPNDRRRVPYILRSGEQGFFDGVRRSLRQRVGRSNHYAEYKQFYGPKTKGGITPQPGGQLPEPERHSTLLSGPPSLRWRRSRPPSSASARRPDPRPSISAVRESQLTGVTAGVNICRGQICESPRGPLPHPCRRQ